MPKWSEKSFREKVGFVACAVFGGVVGYFVAEWSLLAACALAAEVAGVVLVRRGGFVPSPSPNSPIVNL